MEFGLKKCHNFCKSGKVHRKHIGYTMENQIKEADPMKAFKYLRVEQSHNIEHKNEKEKLKKTCVRRLRLTLNTELSAENKMQVIVTLAVP
jgi:hypothetical protein